MHGGWGITLEQVWEKESEIEVERYRVLSERVWRKRRRAKGRNRLTH